MALKSAADGGHHQPEDAFVRVHTDGGIIGHRDSLAACLEDPDVFENLGGLAQEQVGLQEVAGIGMLPTYYLGDDLRCGRLVQLLPDHEPGVLGIHIDDRFIVDGRVDTAAMRPIARLGYSEYATISEAWRMRRPD